jgi:hypothetical protein
MKKNLNDRVYVLRIRSDVFDEVAAKAQREDLTAAQYIRRAVKRELESEQRAESETRNA